VAVLFSHPPASAEARGCQQPIGPTADCAFGLGGTSLLAMHTVDAGNGLWLVETVTFDG